MFVWPSSSNTTIGVHKINNFVGYTTIQTTEQCSFNTTKISFLCVHSFQTGKSLIKAKLSYFSRNFADIQVNFPKTTILKYFFILWTQIQLHNLIILHTWQFSSPTWIFSEKNAEEKNDRSFLPELTINTDWASVKLVRLKQPHLSQVSTSSCVHRKLSQCMCPCVYYDGACVCAFSGVLVVVCNGASSSFSLKSV